MTSIQNALIELKQQLPDSVTLVAVSKTKPITAIQQAYNAGHRVFGENKIQEMTSKYEALPKDIKWHMIGHVQRNKVKYMASYVDLIHAVDSHRLLEEIDKQAAKYDRKIGVLLQLKIATEESKYGCANQEELIVLAKQTLSLDYVSLRGVMAMASNTSDKDQISREFARACECFEALRSIYKNKIQQIDTLSIGMSSDYSIAIENKSTMIRVGSAIFGSRNYMN